MSSQKMDTQPQPSTVAAESETGAQEAPLTSRRRFFATTASVAAASLVTSSAASAQGTGTETRREMVRRVLRKTTRPETGPAKSVQVSAAA